MEQENRIVIPIGNKLPGEYLTDLFQAISELQLLLFERRELDLHESQCYALFMLTDFQNRLVKGNHKRCFQMNE